MQVEQTLILIKPDGVQRRLIGEIVRRFEMVGLKILALKMLTATAEQAKAHYTFEGLIRSAEKSIAHQKSHGVDIKDTPNELAEKLQRRLIAFITAGPVVAMILSGNRAVEMVRKLVGQTEPLTSAPGTIRGDWGHDSYELSDASDRSIRNIVHASGTVDEANYEIPIWFSKEEIQTYTLPIEETLYGKWG